MKFGSRNNDTGKIIFLFFILQFSFLVFNCRDKPTPPPDYQPSIFLSAVDVGVTDAWIKLRTESIEKGAWSIQLKRDGQTIFTLSSSLYAPSSPLDTLILDEGLLPKQTYTYKAFLQYSNTPFDSSTPLFITTMDTTSHNFTWQIDTLGDGNSSVLRDVCIINDTMVLAVGEINVKDSLGNWINPPYNMARWNGREWKLIRVMYNYQGVDYFAPLYSIFAFGINDYWVGSNQPMHWNGSKWRTFDLLSSVWNGWINKIWGSSSSNIYIVGNNGELAFFNGSTWRRLEIPTGQSGTELDILDIWGKSTDYILCIASKRGTQIPSKIIRIKNTHIDTVNWQPQKLLNSVWFKDDRRIYTAGSGVYFYKNGIWRIQSDVPTLYSFSIRGIELNDIWTVGGYGLCAHYNGVSWKSYAEVRMSSGNYYSLSVKSKIIVAVGFENNKAK